LFDQNIINGTIILILISCLVSSFVSESAARKIAVDEKEVVKKSSDKAERILIPVSNPENIQRLIDLAMLIKDQNSTEPLYPLSIVEDDAEADEKINLVRKVIEGVAEQISSGDKKVEVLKKVDLSIVDGIVRTAKAYNISDILISYKAQQGAGNLIFGNIALGLLSKSKQSVIISKILQPLNSFTRVCVVLSANAELEAGFVRVVSKINIILSQVGNSAKIIGSESTLKVFANLIGDKKNNFYQYQKIIAQELNEDTIPLQQDDLLVFLNSRYQTISYDYRLDELTKKVNRNSGFTSFIIFYPDISKTLQDGGLSDISSSALPSRFVLVRKIIGKVFSVLKINKQSNS
jgi:nucleotide-binding universal stress UspA family protein